MRRPLSVIPVQLQSLTIDMQVLNGAAVGAGKGYIDASTIDAQSALQIAEVRAPD